MHLFGDTRDMETCHYHAWTELTGPIHSRSFACKYPNCKLRHILIQLWFRNRHHFHYQNHHEIVIRKFSIEGVLRCYVSKLLKKGIRKQLTNNLCLESAGSVITKSILWTKLVANWSFWVNSFLMQFVSKEFVQLFSTHFFFFSIHLVKTWIH